MPASPGRSRREVQIPMPGRLRALKGVTFGWADVRLLREGWLEVLTAEATSVYFFLCLAANREGVSFYRRARIGAALGLDDSAVSKALRRLLELELVAYRPFREGAADGFHQLLPIPAGGPPHPLAPLVEELACRLRSKVPVNRPAPEHDPILRREGRGQGHVG